MTLFTVFVLSQVHNGSKGFISWDFYLSTSVRRTTEGCCVCNVNVMS